ncbi:hypothetical protein STEG23_021880, partial [Scotinomys teguina]
MDIPGLFHLPMSHWLPKPQETPMSLQWNLCSPAKPSEVSTSIQNWSYSIDFSSSLAEVYTRILAGSVSKLLAVKSRTEFKPSAHVKGLVACAMPGILVLE